MHVATSAVGRELTLGVRRRRGGLWMYPSVAATHSAHEYKKVSVHVHHSTHEHTQSAQARTYAPCAAHSCARRHAASGSHARVDVCVFTSACDCGACVSRAAPCRGCTFPGKEHMFHTGSFSTCKSILEHGPWEGGLSLRRTRQACFFSPLNPKDSPSRQRTTNWTAPVHEPRMELYKQSYRPDHGCIFL